MYMGTIPQSTWLYGNLDYSYSKYHRHIQAHDDWYPDRKNKSLGFKNGGFCDPTLRHSVGLVFRRREIPRGCMKEVIRYQDCAKNSDGAECLNEKISIMEVCPEHILFEFKQRKKWYLRAKVIDNQTYKRAMQISDFNKGRSVSDLKLKTWAHGRSDKLRGDTYWADDRYNPATYRHPHRHDTVNFPDLEYKDIFGGNWGKAAQEEKEKHALSFWSKRSQAMDEVAENKKN